MSKNQTNLEYAELNLSGDNYLKWALDTKIILKAKGLGDCIIDGSNASEKDQYRAILIIRHHLTESLKDQYLTLENPLDLWNELKNRYEHQKTIILPRANYEWRNLRIQDYKSVDEYNSAMFKIVSKLKLCGETVTDSDMLEKTFSTFNPNNMLLQQQYREKGFTTYASLISCLLLAEQNNELLLMNSEMRPPGAKALPEAHTATADKKEANQVNRRNRGRGRGRGRWHGQGRGQTGQFSPYGRPYGQGRGRGFQSSRGRGQGRGAYQGRGQQPNNIRPQGPATTACYRCGMSNHWEKNCRTPKYLVDLYKESIKGKNPEAHLVEHDRDHDFDHDNDDLLEYETSDILKEDK